DITPAHEFEPWSFKIKQLEVVFPDGGIIINLDQKANYRSDLLLGEGTYYHQETQLEDSNIGGLFIVTENHQFEEIRGDNIFIPVENESLLTYLADTYEGQMGIPALWEDTIPLSFHKENSLVYYYFVSPDGKALMPPASDYSDLTVFGAFLVYTLFLCIIVMIITMLSPDHRYSKYWIQLGKTKPTLFSLVSILVIAAMLTFNKLIIDLLEYKDFYLAPGYILVIVLLIIADKMNLIGCLDFGLRQDRLKNGYLLAIVSAFLMTAAIRGFPAGLSTESADHLIRLPLLFFLLALPREMIWRGYIQAKLSRRFGVNWGLIMMALLAAVVHSGYLALVDPWMFLYPYAYLEIALLVPGTAIILGYLYLRTENILSCALMHSLIIWLPGIIHY
ncbi:MAG: CPBP family intramembrane glutamic endopeptidase, partial [Bacillota bacterium]